MEIKVRLSKGILYFTNGIEYNINTKVCTNSQTGEIITNYLPILARHFEMEENIVWKNDWSYPSSFSLKYAKTEEEYIVVYISLYIHWAVNRLHWTDIYERFAEIITWWETIYNIDKRYIHEYYYSLTDYCELMELISLQDFIKHCMPKRQTENGIYIRPSNLIRQYQFDKWVSSLKLKIEIKNEDLWYIFNSVYYATDYSNIHPKFYRTFFNHFYTDIVPLCTNCFDENISYNTVTSILQNYLSAIVTLKLDEPPKTNNFLKWITDIIRMALSAKEKINHEKCIELYEKYKLCETLDTEHFTVVIPKTLDDIKNESLIQNNCLYNSYLSNYINNEYCIAFIRKKNDVSTPFITVGYRKEKNTINFDQSHGKNNCNPYNIIDTSVYEEYDRLISSIRTIFWKLSQNEKK